MQQQPQLQGVADLLANQGRYGDSMLVHMNPAEVQGIAALSPTGQLTTNPVTGQPEAFLPFLAPLLAKFVPAALTKVGLGGLGAAAAAAPGLTTAATSGLMTGIAEGDLEKGIMAGITSFDGTAKPLGIPLLGLLDIEKRENKDAVVIKKAIVDLESPAFKLFSERRHVWAENDSFSSPGPRQYWGPISKRLPMTTALNEGYSNLNFSFGH